MVKPHHSAVASQKAGRGKKNMPAVPNHIIITSVQHISDNNTNTMLIFTSGLGASTQGYPIIHYYKGGH